MDKSELIDKIQQRIETSMSEPDDDSYNVYVRVGMLKEIIQALQSQPVYPDISKSLTNAYEHIQHESYNDALSSILEAQDLLQGQYVMTGEPFELDRRLDYPYQYLTGVQLVAPIAPIKKSSDA